MTPPPAWAHLPFFSQHWPRLRDRLDALPQWLPGPDRIFAALQATAPAQARVVILGQDPYPTPGHANGLAFSVNAGVALPRSLRNIQAELRDDLGVTLTSGDLSGWARQGVLLLNAALSVEPGRAGGHAGWGWDRLGREVIAEAQRHGPVAFVLWGGFAQKAVGDLPRDQDLVLRSPHPSPLSARRGFFGSRPFSQINHWLERQDRPPVNWAA